MQLSIGMMVKNEEHYLNDCLNSLKPILNKVNSELIIVDTGSEDKTVEIAKRYTSKVYYHSWTNNFADMRNITVNYAKGEWFGFFDADEMVEDPAAIINFFTSELNKNYNAACIQIKNILSDETEASVATGYALRFFRKDNNFCFKGIIHEQPQFKYPIYSIPATVLHYGYLSTDKRLMEEKYHRNLTLLQAAIEEEPDNIYYWFQLSQTYGMYKVKAESLKAIKKAYELVDSHQESKKKYIYVLNHLAKTYFNNQMFEESIQASTEGIDADNRYIDFYYYRANSFFELKSYESAVADCKTYLNLRDNYANSGGVIDLSVTHATLELYETVYRVLCISQKNLGKNQQAIKYAQNINSSSIYRDVIPTIIDIYLEAGDFENLVSLYNKRIHNDTNIQPLFVKYLEYKRNNLAKEEKEILSRHFQGAHTLYGLLNQVRSNYYREIAEKSDEIYAKILEVNLTNLEYFYGDILFYVIRHKYPVVPLMQLVKDHKIKEFLCYLEESYEEFSSYLVRYLSHYKDIHEKESNSDELLRIKVVLYGIVLRLNDLDDKKYKGFFQDYVNCGIKYINRVYYPELIASEKVSWARTDSDAFLFYMSLAQNVGKDDLKYVRFLRKALQQDGSMKKGIEILLADMHSGSSADLAQELESHKQTIISTVESCINTGDLENAKSLIKEYEAIVGVDVKLCSVKSVLLMIEQDFEEAKKTLLTGLALDVSNPDLLYNLGYLNELTQEKEEAITNYRLAYWYTSDVEAKADIEQALMRLETTKITSLAKPQTPKITVIIPTYNQKVYLKEAIDSVLYQDYPNLEVLVGDDCSTDGTDTMMKHYQDNPRVRYIRHEYNLGAGNNSSHLLKNYVHSEYAMILNHDDYLIKQDYISCAIRLLTEKPNISFVWANSNTKYQDNGKTIRNWVKLPEVTSGLEYFLNYETSQFPHISGVHTTVFDYNKLKRSGYGSEKSYSRDTFMHLKLMLEGDVGFITDHVAVYRVHQQSISYNMPLEFDALTISEFEKLRTIAVNKGIFNSKQIEEWLERRVFTYVIWRFKTLWSQNKLKDAINILVSISASYPWAYRAILDTVFKP